MSQEQNCTISPLTSTIRNIAIILYNGMWSWNRPVSLWDQMGGICSVCGTELSCLKQTPTNRINWVAFILIFQFRESYFVKGWLLLSFALKWHNTNCGKISTWREGSSLKDKVGSNSERLHFPKSPSVSWILFLKCEILSSHSKLVWRTVPFNIVRNSFVLL